VPMVKCKGLDISLAKECSEIVPILKGKAASALLLAIIHAMSAEKVCSTGFVSDNLYRDSLH
jgi:hypothetical protein